MKIRFLILTLLFVWSIVYYVDSAYAEEFKTFDIDGYTITVDSQNVISLELDGGSGEMPSGSIVFDKVITDKVIIQIPKEMSRTVNLDFGFDYYALQSNGYSTLPVKLTENDHFDFLIIPVRNSDKVTIGSTLSVTDRSTIIVDPLTSVLENCTCQDSVDPCMQPRLAFLNSTHYIDNNDCKWRLLPTEADCPSHTKWTDGMCIVIPVERGLFMHGVLGPLLLVILVGVLVSPIYVILKFKKPINKVLFIMSILITAIILSQVIYGEFFLIGDPGVAPNANESHFFALSILGSFFITISFSVLGIVYWRKNEHPNKMMVFTFFIIAIVPIIALMIGLLPRGAEA